MRQFVARLGIFVAIQAMIGVALLQLDPGANDSALASFLEKDARLEQTADRPRLMIVGGSNVPFGLDSEQLGEAFPDYSVTNLGISASLGLDFMLNHVGSRAQRGDMVLLAPEYLHFATRCSCSPALIDMMRICPRTSEFLSVADWKDLGDSGLGNVRYVCRRIQPRLRGVRPNEFRRNDFNSLGDMVAHHDMPPTYQKKRIREKGFSAKWDVQTNILDQQVQRLNEFAEKCRAEGIEVVLSYPPLSETSWNANQQIIVEIREKLSQELKIPILNEEMTPSWPDEMYFDTEWHLTAAGKEQRTAELIASMRRFRPEPESGRLPVIPATAKSKKGGSPSGERGL